MSLLNSKQKFIINSGNVSFAVFIVQLINFLKSSVISLINQSGNAESLIIIIINFLFDLYPLFFFYKYREYLGQMDRKKLLNATLISEDDIRWSWLIYKIFRIESDIIINLPIMKNDKNKEKIYSISYNSDGSLMALATNRGFKVYSTNPAMLKQERDFGAPIAICELINRSNLIGLVGFK